MSLPIVFKEWISQDVQLDDSFDRLHRKHMASFLLVVLIPILGKQYVGNPIQCMTPTTFSGEQVQSHGRGDQV